MLKTIVGDITKANTDVIVNASNGIGFMGGIIGKEKGIATHSSILAWKTPQTDEPGELQSMGSQRVGHS